jgi:hypothetical protein
MDLRSGIRATMKELDGEVEIDVSTDAREAGRPSPAR